MNKICEYNSNNAFNYNRNNGNVNNNNKNNSLTCRAVSDFQDRMPPYFEIYEDIRLAYNLCMKNKRHTVNALDFWENEAYNLTQLAQDVYNREYVPKPSITFIITKPKRREVIAANFRDRIIQHYIVMRLEPIFERYGIIDEDMYSCRTGKGNMKAVMSLYDKIYEVSNGYTEDCYIAKIDIKSFFMSIDKEILLDKLENIINQYYNMPDKDILLYLVRIVTLNCPQDNAIRKTPIYEWVGLEKGKSLKDMVWYKGLAIGNITSQMYANLYNSDIVNFIKFLLLIVVNYVDDFSIIDKDKNKILQSISMIREKMKEYGLVLHPDKFYIQHYSKGCKFLGLVVKNQRIYVNNQTVSRCYQKIHYYNEAYAGREMAMRKKAEKFVSILNSYLGLMSHFSSYNIRKNIADLINDEWKNIIFPNESFTKFDTKFKKRDYYCIANKRMRKIDRHKFKKIWN